MLFFDQKSFGSFRMSGIGSFQVGFLRFRSHYSMYVVLRAQGCWSLFFFFQVVQSVLVCFKLVRLLWVVVGCQSRVLFLFFFSVLEGY